MRPTSYYRSFIWLPLAMPAIALLVNGLGLAPTNPLISKFVQWQVMSLLYGGPVYVPLAAWATWWVGGRSEADVRRLMFRAPILMATLFAMVALPIGVAVGQLRVFAGVALLGAVTSVVLGYAYVALAVVLRPSGRGAA